MKHETKRRPGERGSALVVALFAAVLAVGLAFSSTTVATQHGREALSSQRGLRARYLAESGLSLALAELAKGNTGVLGAPGDPVSLGGGEYFVETATDASGQTRLRATATVGEQVRSVEAAVLVSARGLFEDALFGDIDIGANGSVFVDSYSADAGPYLLQATNLNLETGKLYARPNANIISNGTVTLRGGTTAFGNLRPGPGQVPVIKGSPIYVSGEMTPLTSRKTLPPVAYEPTIETAGDMTLSEGRATLTAGDYRFHKIEAKNSSEIRIQGDVTLYLDGDLKLSGQAKIVLDPDASLTIYQAGKNMALDGGGVANTSGRADHLVVYSRADNVSIGGVSELYGAVYAPNASISVAGVPEIYGSLIGRQVNLSGTVRFHYDETLGSGRQETETTIRLSVIRPVSPDSPFGSNS